MIENSKIFTEWNSVTQTLNPLLESQVFRSENGDPFQFVGSVDSSAHFYIDDDVDVFNSKYEYVIVSKIVVKLIPVIRITEVPTFEISKN